ncbi:hypothetical protein E3N88_13411 [Mikania micrantha]|uniref:Uncharacterized protein n=1 Tax=Mikania micrantha TaxID=192012 RepID=A0A5N6PA50_9ASTR|nr:hypothetical protein E3N88_13411 [Mikania micrantha]
MSMYGKDTNRILELKTPDGSVELRMPGLDLKEMKACADRLPHIREAPFGHDQAIIDDGMLRLTHPNGAGFKTDIMANIIANIFATFNDITLTHSWPYYDMFSDRSILGNRFCPVLGMVSHINSFSMYKNVAGNDLDINIRMPGREDMMLTMQGLRVCLDMRQPDIYSAVRHGREDIKTYFNYDTFFIEAKTKEEHHITGIRLPEGIHMKHNMIKRKMEDRMFYAFLPCVKKDQVININ